MVTMAARLGATAAAAVLAACGSTLLPGAASAAPPDSGTLSSEVAEAQFRSYLLTHTTLHPTDVSCSLPPTHDPDGEMICFALVDGREAVAALATLVSPGEYSFAAIVKSASPASASASLPGAGPVDTPATPDTPGMSPDAAALDAIASVTGPDVDDLTHTLLDFNEQLTAIDSITFDAPTGTVQVRAISSATAAAERDWLGWRITDTMAFLWEAAGPLRAEGVTLQPRLEVIVDGAIYGTPFPVMIDVADYAITFEAWLAITTGADHGDNQAGGARRGGADVPATRRSPHRDGGRAGGHDGDPAPRESAARPAQRPWI